MGGKAVPLSPGRAVSPGRTSLEVVATKTTIKQTATGVSGRDPRWCAAGHLSPWTLRAACRDLHRVGGS